MVIKCIELLISNQYLQISTFLKLCTKNCNYAKIGQGCADEAQQNKKSKRKQQRIIYNTK